MSARLPNRIAPFFACNTTTNPPPSIVRRYKVILHRSANVDLAEIARTLRELTHYADAEATFRMWDAYQNGWTLVLTTHLERAELFVEQLGNRGLCASVEPE